MDIPADNKVSVVRKRKILNDNDLEGMTKEVN